MRGEGLRRWILSAEKGPGIESPKISSLREPFQKIFLKLQESIDSGEYNLIIGDDASGRIPALVVRNFIKEVYAKRGYPKPATRFFAGSGRSERTERYKKRRRFKKSLKSL